MSATKQEMARSGTGAAARLAAVRPETAPDVLILTSSLFMDRILLYSQLLPGLAERATPRLWVTSADTEHRRQLWSTAEAEVVQFPKVAPFREFPYNFFRRLNDFLWDFRHEPPSRMSMWRHVRRDSVKPRIRALRGPAYALSKLHVERVLETSLERLLLSYERSPEAVARLEERRPDVVVTTGPFQFEQPAVVAAAKRAGIPVVAMIPSWDNLSTKNRLVFRYDGYVVWSETSREELYRFYPETRNVPVYVVGAPQFDLFAQTRFHQSRADFCASQGLDPSRKIVVYAVGSPNFIKGEHHGALHVAERMAKGELGDVQMIVRPHPLHDNGALQGLFEPYRPNVIVQRPADVDASLTARTQDENQIVEWVNTFKHADVVVNLSSTVTIDAAIFDRPVVNLDFDPEPGGPLDPLINDVNHHWTHFKPVAESGGVWLVANKEEMMGAIKGYLENPALHREQRAWIVEHVCGYTDGKCSDRLASALLDFARYSATERARS